MNVQTSRRKSSVFVPDRAPVWTEDEAVNRLVRLALDPLISLETFEALIAFVSDVYWLSENTLRHKVQKRVLELGGAC